MIIFGIQNNKSLKLILPEIIAGDFILSDNFEKQVGNIKSVDNKWVLYPSFEYTIEYNGTSPESLVVENYIEFVLKNKITGNIITLYSYPTYEANPIEYSMKNSEITIGSDASCDVCFSSPNVSKNFCKITLRNEKWFIECNENCYAFVDSRLVKKKRINYGETIFIHGLKIICICDFIIFINCVKNYQLKFKQGSFAPRQVISQEIKETSFKAEGEFEALDRDKEFYRSPRFRTKVVPENITIKQPPGKVSQSIQPAILTVGPQLTMLLTSVITMSTSLISVVKGTAEFASVGLSILLSSIAMISALFWPMLTRRFNKKTQAKNELKRIKNYREYLKSMDKKIGDIVSKQKQILIENSISLEECQQIIHNKKRNLWERNIVDDDFLNVRVGIGFVKPNIDFEVDQPNYGDNDILLDEMMELVKKYEVMEDTPSNVSLIDNRISAVVGNYGVLHLFFESILLQLMTFHMYNDLKIVIFSNETLISDWDFIKFAPHCWDNNKQRRFLCSTMEEKKQTSTYLENIFKSRMEAITGGEEKKVAEEANTVHDEYLQFNSYYLIIIDDIKSCRNLEIVNMILKNKENLGFSIIIKNDRISNLPSECSTFFNITDTESGMFKSNLSEDNQLKFKAELNKTVNVEACIKELANIYINVPKDAHELPKSVGFMEMYGVGNVDQFNSQNRWTSNNPVASLSVPVGIDQQGELFYFDIHEKAYGPHGLVAGTTGSGKSEWIITYILSLCVNFSPLEVQFVLIDYKGGGLAGSFVNEETGMRLPHLVGTITNLDKSEIRRSLASLEAESKRRQRMFNEAREKLNDSSMNIYKYQQYYRKGMLDEPLSHLFIISDEFAELKSQEPEFLQQLVSIARIGRSLGIHLILATQKPAGVVDDQMWSNSRFKICLRVQDKSDSNDMIKCDDAAYLHQTGAFYLQVGLNEVFALGQSAYAGGKYKPTSVLKKNIDTSVDVLNNIGDSINKFDYIEPETIDESKVHGEELLNIILYVSDLAKKQQLVSRRLWLDAIPGEIYVDNLKKQFGFKRVPYDIKAIVGEYDDPYRQYQGLLEIGINNRNTFIVGQTGSGKEQLIQSMIYSIMTNYLPQEVCIYILDFGAETLSMFENSPHVGDVIYNKDTTKIFNFFKYLNKVLKNRKEKYREAGGTFEAYNRASTTKDNLIVSFINSVSFIKENNEDQLNELNALLLDGPKYGICFVESDIDQNIHRGKVFETFSNFLCLKVADYVSVLGSKARGVIPKDLKGRGLIEVNNEIYEFQSAKICEETAMQKTVRFICDKFMEAYKFKHNPVPVIPNPINFDVIKDFDLSVNNVCMGYSIVNIEPLFFDLQKNVATLIMGSKKAQLKNFFRVFNRELDVCASKGTKVYLFDPEDIYKPEGYENLTYVPQVEIVNTVKNLMIYVNNEYDKYNALENKKEYQAPSRSLIVFHSVSIIFGMIGYDLLEQLSIVIDKALELKLFDFVVADNLLDYKEFAREKTITHLFVESNGLCISTSFDGQPTLDIGTKDMRVKDSLPDKQGYAILLGKAKYVQVLEQDSSDEEV